MLNRDLFIVAPSRCNHESVKVTLTPHLTHHAREDCQVCGAFVRWLPKPSTLARDLENGRKIEALNGNPKLTDWEREFVFSLLKQGRGFSPKQQAILDRIYANAPAH